MAKGKIKKLRKDGDSRMLQTADGIWTIRESEGGILIELCRPGEENLTHPEGNEMFVAFGVCEKEHAVTEMLFVSRAMTGTAAHP